MTDRNNTIATPYDNAYRTLLTHCRRLIIPLVNEMFDEDYTINDQIELLQNERFVSGANKIITDSHFIIAGRRYHIECQSTLDGTMLIRVFEYDAQIALDDSTFQGNSFTVRFPESGILFLRHSSDTPDEMLINISVPRGSVSYKVPVLKAQEYDLDNIFEKKLFFLLPFHLFIFEKDMEQIENSEEKLAEFRNYYQELRMKLEAACEHGEISSHDARTVLEMAVEVGNSLARKYDKVREEVGSIMGGIILEHEAENIMNEGRDEGREEGESHLAELMQKLFESGRNEDAVRAASDPEYRKQLYQDFSL